MMPEDACVSLLGRGHDKTLSERSVEEILFLFPYLIDKRLRAADLNERSLALKDGTMPDLVFQGEQEKIVVELKIAAVGEGDVKQLVNYLKQIKEVENVNASGILIGVRVTNEHLMKETIERSGFDIVLKVYGDDVPTIIKFCKHCRRASGYAALTCEKCGSTDFFYDSHHRQGTSKVL